MGALAAAVAAGAAMLIWIVGTGALAEAVATGGETVWLAETWSGGLRLIVKLART